LSADPNRTLIGDDEHGWSDDGVFNFEGGCYAKVIRLSREGEPEIYETTRRFGTILENVAIDTATRHVNLDDALLAENTRAAYPITHIPNMTPKGVRGHPKDIIMLTCGLRRVAAHRAPLGAAGDVSFPVASLIRAIVHFNRHDSVIAYPLFLLPLFALDDPDDPALQQTAHKRGFIHQHENIHRITILRARARHKTEVVGKRHASRQNLFQQKHPLTFVKRVFVPAALRRLDDHLQSVGLFIKGR